ncbi:glycosyltransferase [Shewanella sp. 10B]|uniref:glycosyltransferase n=1 Tax=Shewanella sp. 10B TaxID=2943322 RepID=UPI00201A6DC7|nr:glycosyltransferase [Shewanella sp. 10B]
MISIVTVTYNNSKGLEKTLKSIQKQTDNAYELIVIDGGSKDNTASILESYHNIISFSLSENDSGIYDAMNKGVKFCTSPFVIFMNAGDCFFDSSSVQKINREVKQGDSIYVADCICRTSYGLEKKIMAKPLASYSMPTSHQSIIFPTRFVNYDLQFKICSDFDLYSRLKKEFAVHNLNFYLSLTEGGGVSSKYKYRSHREKFRINRVHKNFFVSSVLFLYEIALSFFKDIFIFVVGRDSLSVICKRLFK